MCNPLESLRLKCLGLNCARLKYPGLKLEIEKFRNEMYCNLLKVCNCLGLKSLGLKCARLKYPGLKFEIEKFGNEMYCNPLESLQLFGVEKCGVEMCEAEISRVEA